MRASITALEQLRKQFAKRVEAGGGKLTVTAIIAKVIAVAMRKFPQVNSSVDMAAEEVVYKSYVNIGIAVDTERGLVVPVIRNADRMGFAEIEKTIAEFGRKAKEGQLTMQDMQGGTFTISNGGVFGSLLSTPIINPPQSAVLGMHRIEERPVVRDGQIVIKPMMYLALSYDHRLIDGREAVTFLVRMKEAIEDPTRLLIDL